MQKLHHVATSCRRRRPRTWSTKVIQALPAEVHRSLKVWDAMLGHKKHHHHGAGEPMFKEWRTQFLVSPNWLSQRQSWTPAPPSSRLRRTAAIKFGPAWLGSWSGPALQGDHEAPRSRPLPEASESYATDTVVPGTFVRFSLSVPVLPCPGAA